jgi:hypothetical protein
MKARFLFAPDEGPGGSGGENDGDPADGGTTESQAGTGSGSDGQDLIPREELQKVNREAARYRRERNELQNRLKAFEDAEKSDLERLTGENKTLSETLKASQERERVLRVQVMASRVGVAPDAQADAAKLLDWGTIEDPDSDQLVEAALKDLVKERPYLRGGTRVGADGGAGGDGRSTAAGMNEQIRRASGRR